jgi:hypothetical protein
MKINSTVPKLFSELAVLEEAIFSAKERAEVDRFIRVGEYGLALETTVDICVEEGKEPSADFMAKVVELALALEMNPSVLMANNNN